MARNGRVVRLKVSPMMGWLAGSAISLVPSLLSARHGISPVGAVLYRHHLPAEFQFTEENRAKQQTFGRRKTRSTARQAALFGLRHGWGHELAFTGAQGQARTRHGLLSEGARGRTRAALRSTSARDVRVPGRASPMAQGQAEVQARGRARRGSEGSKRLLKRGE